METALLPASNKVDRPLGAFTSVLISLSLYQLIRKKAQYPLYKQGNRRGRRVLELVAN